MPQPSSRNTFAADERIVSVVPVPSPSRAAMGSLTLLLVVALTMQLAPMVANAGPAARGYEQVRFAEPLRIVLGVPARRQGEKNDRVSTFARRAVVPTRVWDCVLAAPSAAAVTGAMHLRIESLVSLPPPMC